MPVTWNPSDKSANITLSGGDLTATDGASGATYDNVRSTIGHTSGKKYFEITLNVEGSTKAIAFGLANASATLTNYMGIDNNSIGAFSYLGDVWINNADTGFRIGATSPDVGEVVCIAADFDNDRVWLREGAAGNWLNSGAADPATNTGGVDMSAITGTIYAALGGYDTSDQCTVNFGATAFTGAVPSGFSAWEEAAPLAPSGYPFLGRATARKLALRKAFSR